MGKKTGYIVYIVLFLVACCLPSLGMLRGGETESRSNEAVAARPVLRMANGAWNENYLNDLTDYLSDNWFLRPQMISAWSWVNQTVFHTSTAEDVILGQDGWLYFAGTLPDYAGTDPLEDGECRAIAENLRMMQAYCESQGTEFLFTIAPNKNSLYPEHMPPVLPVAGQPGNAARLAEALRAAGVSYLDLFSLFQEQEETLYYALDTHWNQKGAALAADAINAAFGRTSAYFDGPFMPDNTHTGDLYAMLYPTGTVPDADWAYDGDLSITYVTPFRSPEDLVIDTTGGGTGTLLLFRDSFGNALYPYLADSFAGAYFSRAVDYRLYLLEERPADCAAIELVERNLRYLLQNIPVMPAPQETCSATEKGPEIMLNTTDSTRMPGYTLVTGTLPEDFMSVRVYLDTPTGCYQAFLQENGGFGLYVPTSVLAMDDTDGTDGVRVLYERPDGGFTAAPATQ